MILLGLKSWRNLWTNRTCLTMDQAGTVLIST